MIESAMYVIEKTTDPVINYYDQNKKNHRMSDSQLEILEKLNNNAKNAKAMLSRFKRTGDVYKYLKAIIGTKNDEVATNFRRFGLVPFEDIIDEFEKKFKDNLFETTTIDDFIIEECYTTWDVIFLANNYNQRGYGILSIKNNNNNIVEGIVVRGKFDTTENNYANIWINDNELLYHLIGQDYRTNHVNNSELLTGKYPIYVFHTIGPNMQVYRGEFVLSEYLKEQHQVRLIRSNESEKVIGNNTVKEYRLPTTGKFTKQIEKRDSNRFGTSVINENKIKSGQKAEQNIIDYLNNVGMVTLNVADDPTYAFDIYLPDMEIGLEVKNISSGYFYISENEMRQIEKEKTRLVFVDEDNFFVSKSYTETIELKSIFSSLREIDSFIIENYGGLYSSDDLRIAITEDREPKIKADFIRINSLSIEELIELFK